MTADGEPLEYDEIIAMRDRLCNRCGWGGQVIRYGERYIPMPKMENMNVYRGETYNHGSIHSGVYRADDTIGECIREAKMNEFIWMIEDVLSIQMPVRAIAQHYGLHTDCLDFSGSFSVALFFATCKWDRRKGRYRPLNHREIKEHPIGVIYVTMPMAYSNDPDSFMPIGYSVLKRPSLQHGYLMVDHGNLSQKDFGIIRMEQSVRLSNEMYRFFGNGEYLLPSHDQQRIEQFAREMNESDSVNRGLFLEACRRRGMTEDDDELISKYQGYRMMDEPRTIPIEDKVLIDWEIRENDFIRETGMRFTCRLPYTGRSHPMSSIGRSDQTSP